MIQLTDHARRRCQQRAIPRQALEAALAWGQMIPLEDGRDAFYLGQKATQQARQFAPEVIEHLHVLVILSPDQWVVTAIRTPHLRKISKKGKRRRNHAR